MKDKSVPIKATKKTWKMKPASKIIVGLVVVLAVVAGTIWATPHSVQSISLSSIYESPLPLEDFDIFVRLTTEKTLDNAESWVLSGTILRSSNQAKLTLSNLGTESSSLTVYLDGDKMFIDTRFLFDSVWPHLNIDLSEDDYESLFFDTFGSSWTLIDLSSYNLSIWEDKPAWVRSISERVSFFEHQVFRNILSAAKYVPIDGIYQGELLDSDLREALRAWQSEFLGNENASFDAACSILKGIEVKTSSCYAPLAQEISQWARKTAVGLENSNALDGSSPSLFWELNTQIEDFIQMFETSDAALRFMVSQRDTGLKELLTLQSTNISYAIERELSSVPSGQTIEFPQDYEAFSVQVSMAQTAQ